MDPLYIIVFAGNCILTSLLTVTAARFSLQFRLLYKGIPLIGGLAIVAVFLIDAFTFSAFMSPQTAFFVLAALIIFLMGVLDDMHELSVTRKFVFQIAAALIVAFSGIRTHIVFIGEPLNYVITVLWIVGITNALNLLDIADGLAAGCSLIVCAGLATVALLNAAPDFPSFALVSLTGIMCGFLFMNLPPAKVYLGNSGSHFIGFVIAVLAIKISYATMERGMALFTPLVILGFPIFDTMFLIFIRLSKWKLPFYKTRDHIAMRLSALGYRPGQMLGTMLSVCLLFSAGGVLISQASNSQAMFIICMLAVFVFILSRKTLTVIVND